MTEHTTPRTHNRRAECNQVCPLTAAGHCDDHKLVISTSRWAIGLVVGLLLSILGAQAGVYSTVSDVRALVAVAASRSLENESDIDDVRRDVHEIERAVRIP